MGAWKGRFFFWCLGGCGIQSPRPSWGSKQFGDTTRLRSPHLKRDLASQIVEAVTYWCGDLIDFYSSHFFQGKIFKVKGCIWRFFGSQRHSDRNCLVVWAEHRPIWTASKSKAGTASGCFFRQVMSRASF